MDLISAAGNGNFEMAFNLLRSGIKPDAVRDKDSATPLYWSSCNGHTNLCEILIEAGSDVNATVTWGSTPLHAAADRAHKSCIDVLIDSGANINAKNHRGDTALHIAAYRGHLDIVMTLLKAHADMTVKNIKGKTPHQEAIEGGHRNVAKAIVYFAKGEHNQWYGVRQPESQNLQKKPLIQISDVNWDSRTLHGVGNGTSKHRVLMQQHSLDDVGMPLQPASLCRRFSVEGSEAYLAIPAADDNSSHSEKTLSFGSIDQIYDDINMDVSALKLNNHWQKISKNDSLLQVSAYSNGMSGQCVTYNNSVATENSDNTDCEHSGKELNAPAVLPRKLVTSGRQVTASLNSVQEVEDENDGLAKLINTLEKLLVASNEKNKVITQENEIMKYKCSTLISKVTEIEIQFNDSVAEREFLRDAIELKSREVQEKDIIIRRLKKCRSSGSVRKSTEGLKKLSVRLSKELSEETAAELRELIRETLRSHALNQEYKEETFDVPQREWLPDIDFVIQQTLKEPARPGESKPKRMSFVIRHKQTGKKLILKMIIRVKSTQEPVDIYSLYPDNALDILEHIGCHPNIEKILHTYEGSTKHFQKCLPACFSHAEMQLCDTTTFYVTEELINLTRFLESSSKDNYSWPIYEFLIHVLYLLLSVLCHLGELDVVHNNINIENIFIDDNMKPILGGFDRAYRNDRKRKEFDNTEHSNEIQNGGVDYVDISDTVSRGLKRSYPTNKKDLSALGKMFKSILQYFPETIVEDTKSLEFSYEMKTSVRSVVVSVVDNMVSTNQLKSFSTKQCLQRIGFAMFGPGKDEINNLFDCHVFLKTHMLKLLSSNPPNISTCLQHNDFEAILERLAKSSYEIEAHFLCNTNPIQLWEICRSIEQDHTS